MLGARPQRPPPPPAATADAATATTPLLDRIFNGRGREPVLPVRTQKVRFTCSKAISNGGSWHPSKSSVKPTSKQRLRCAAAWAVLVLLVAATVGAVAIYTYVQSILHEDPAAVAEAAAEARAAARAAATQQPEVLAYTVVVMSYVKRLGTVRTVVNKLGSCPSVTEVLLVWNGADPPSPSFFDSSAPVRIRQESKNDLSNRLRADDGIRTEAVFLADDDVLMRCSDVERAFAKWQANRQALVGLFPRLVHPGPPPQYHGERVVFRRCQFNTVLTGAEFVSLSLLRLYWSERFTRGREVVRQLTNCEDLLLNFVTAAAIRDQGKQQISTSAARTTAGAQQDSSAAAAGHADGAAADPPALPGAGVLRWPPHVLWTQPGRRLDISVLSGVGISRGTAVHGVTRAQCIAQFTGWFGDVLQTERIEWEQGNAAKWRLLSTPLRSLPWLGLGVLYL